MISLKYFISICLLTSISWLLLPFILAAETKNIDLPTGVFGYKETVGKKVIPFNWQAQERDNKIIIKVFEEQKSFFNICTADGATLKLKLASEGQHDIVAERIEDFLHIKGIRFGEKYDQKIKIDERPWYQPLSFSLGPFLDSKKEYTSFWVIRADNIEVIALTARKMGEEKITLENKPVLTQKVEVRAEGFKSKFWHATYWYRKKDNLFLRYQSVHGLPGTNETIVELIESPSGQLDS